MTAYGKTLGALFCLFLLVNGLYLHRVPGLMGDEGSEGQNVYELLNRKGVTVMGERSYIGPLIDYVRVPFIKIFGYTALALRVPILLASLATFAMAASVFRRWFGETVSLFPLVLVTFSLPYLTHQRLGWAITLLPFFFFLTVWFACLPDRQAQGKWQYKWLLVGLAAGLGLHTHIMFAPTLAALTVIGFINFWMGPASSAGMPADLEGNDRGKVKRFLAFLPAVISFWAAFSTQFVILQLVREDQGNPGQVAELFSQRLADLPTLLPVILSGSSYVALYTGVEFASWVATSVMWLVIILAALGVALSWRNKVVWFWLIGLAVHVLVLLYMIDRFSLRYFLMFVLGVYVLAGVGAGELTVRLARLTRQAWLGPVKTVGLAAVLSAIWAATVLFPFLGSGGSVANFSLGNRTDSAAALVDVRPLLSCLRGTSPALGGVSSENVHIYNRLLYLSHQYPDLIVVNEETAREADRLVHYRDQKTSVAAGERELCPQLTHFVVVATAQRKSHSN